MAYLFPGYPGPVNPRQRGFGSVAMPAMPAVPFHPGGQPVGGAHPLAGLAAYGVPVGLAAGGQPVLQAGLGAGSMLPPEIPGMPRMPGPPDGLMSGGPIGGLFHPLAPVPEFDAGNQVRALHEQGQTSG